MSFKEQNILGGDVYNTTAPGIGFSPEKFASVADTVIVDTKQNLLDGRVYLKSSIGAGGVSEGIGEIEFVNGVTNVITGSAVFSGTKGLASRINVFLEDPGTGELTIRIENLLGADKDIEFSFLAL